MNRLPASPDCGEFEYIIMVGRDRRDVWQHRDDEVTRTELVGWTGTRIRELWSIARQREQRDCTATEVCAKEIKNTLSTLDGGRLR